MNDKPLVSVVIPLYNAERYVEQCIRSVLAQNWPNVETIIVDDGSTDRSLELVKKIGSDKIIIINQPNSGASVARNTGLMRAKGKFIQFLDADDILSPGKIASQVAVLSDAPDCLALCPTCYFNDGEDPYSVPVQHEWFKSGSDNPIDFLAMLYNGKPGGTYGGMIQTNAWLVPRHIVDKAGLWNTMRSPDDDGEFFCRVVLASKGVRYTDEGINYYRKFSQKQTWSTRMNHETRAAVLQSWILKSRHLQPYLDYPGISKALAINFTKLCYDNYPAYPDLSKQAMDLAINYGGLQGLPYFGNRFYNKWSRILPWRMALYLQDIYQQLKAR